MSKSNSFKIIRKEQVKGFLSFEQNFNLSSSSSSSPIFPAKLQINLESDGILFELELNQKIALMFLDPLEKTISFIESSKHVMSCHVMSKEKE